MMIRNIRTPESEGPPVVSEEATRGETDRFSTAEPEAALFAVVIHDDNFHTCRDYIETFQEIFGYSQPGAYELTQELARVGRAVVWKGPEEEAIHKAERAQDYQPRWRRGESVTAPRWVDESVPPLTITVVSARSIVDEVDS